MKTHKPSVLGSAVWRAALVAALAWAAANPLRAGAKVDEVVIVFKTHFDIGYTDMAANVVQRYRTTMIDDALKVAEQSESLPPAERFVWTIPGWPLAKIMEDWSGQTPERREKLRRAFGGGRFAVHALPFTTHTELLELEDLTRGLGFASRLSREAGLDLPRDAKMTDVPCHAWIMPTLLRNAGVDFLHIGCNAASRSPEVPRLFWWEGPDGSRLLTMYTAESYGTGLVPPADWPHKTWLALIHTGDNHGPPTPDEVRKLLDTARRELPGVRVRIGRLSDFADAILREKTEIPVVRGDMPDSWIHGPACDPIGAQWARKVRPMIAATEALDTLLGAFGAAAPDATSAIAAAYENSLLYGEHTWGGALYWVTKYAGGASFNYGEQWKKERSEGRFKRLEESWEEHTTYIEAARDLFAPILQRDVLALAEGVRFEGDRVVVFNPLPWPRDGVVSCISGPEGPTFECFVRNVPAIGYATFDRKELSASQERREPPTGTTLENAHFRVALDPARGAIASLIDKRSGRELVDAAAPHGFGQYLYERFDADQVAAYVKAYVKIDADWAVNELGKPSLPPAAQAPYRAASPVDCALSLGSGRYGSFAMMRSRPGGALPYGVTTTVMLYDGIPCLDITVAMEKLADPWPEAGWISFPFKIDRPSFRLGRQGSIVDPARDIVPGANRHLYGVTTGVAVMDPDGRGVGLCPIDTQLVSLDTPGIWKYSRDFVPKRPIVYVHLFNNQWTTNFRYWNEGTMSARVRLWAFDRFDPESSLITPSLDARTSMVGATSGAKGGALPARLEGLSLSRKGVQVTAFGANPDGPGTILRLWELAGAGGPCTVRLAPELPWKRAQPVDLRGRPNGAPIEIRGGAFEAPLRPFAPASFVLER